MKKLLVGLVLLPFLTAAALASVQSIQGIQPTDRAGQTVNLLYPKAASKLDLTTTSGASASGAISSGVLRVVCTADCFYAVAAAPTATTSSHFLPAGVPYDLVIPSGWKIAGITSSGTATMYITEME